MANADIAREALDYYKARDAEQAPRQAKMDALTEQLANQQISTSAFNDQQARDQWDRYKAYGIPAEDAMYADAANYDSKEQLDKAAGQAATDVDTSMAQAADARRRTLARQGVNPADGRALSMEQDTATQGALAKAAAMNGARDQRHQMGVMLRKDAAGFGRGATGTAAQTFGVASAAGGQASGAVGAAIGSANQSTQTMGTGFGTAINGNNSAGSIMGGIYGNQLKAASDSSASTGQSVGALASAAAMYFSDQDMKEGRAPVDERAALKGVRALNVQQWRYKPGTPADDGGQQHIGAMAQDMQAHLGDEVAPDGKMVDTASAIGASMAAIKALDKKVDRLAARGVKR
jgi:hypothetical protein